MLEIVEKLTNHVVVIILDETLEPFKQLGTLSNKRLNTLNQNLCFNSLLRKQIENFEKLVVGSLVANDSLALVEKLQFLG